MNIKTIAELNPTPTNQLELFQPKTQSNDCLYLDGVTYESALDLERLGSQLLRVFRLMQDGKWRTLAQIASLSGGTEASVSARLRDFRKDRFGTHTVERRRVEPADFGLFEYRPLVDR